MPLLWKSHPDSRVTGGTNPGSGWCFQQSGNMVEPPAITRRDCPPGSEVPVSGLSARMLGYMSLLS